MDMDIDMDLNLDTIDDDAAAAADYDMTPTFDDSPIPVLGMPVSTPSITAPDDGLTVNPSKIHIRGLDEFTSDDIIAYCSIFTNSKIERIEWINDTAANIVYGDDEAAADALLSLTTEFIRDQALTQLRTAKPFAARPGAILQVRLAHSNDRKQPRAYETSRFYLLHPEHDPRENGVSRRRRPSKQSDQRFRKRRYNEEEDRRRKRVDVESGYNPSMYDDQGSLEAGECSSAVSRSKRALDSYRPDRDRSASPRSSPGPRNGIQRSRSPFQRKGSSGRSKHVDNRDKELLPGRNDTKHGEKDLFSSDLLLAKNKRHKPELFPNKTPLSNHRRTDAIDTATDTAVLLASKMKVPFTDGTNDTKSLADRISRPVRDESAPSASNCAGRRDEELSIKGISSQGITVRGRADTLRELFPDKSNQGKELFTEKFRKGRGASRIQAEDMFSC